MVLKFGNPVWLFMTVTLINSKYDIKRGNVSKVLSWVYINYGMDNMSVGTDKYLYHHRSLTKLMN